MAVNNQLNLGVTPLPNDQGGTGSGLTPVASATYVTTAGGITQFSSSMVDGQVIIGDTGGTPVAANFTPGSGIAITNGPGSVTIATTGGIADWSAIAGTTQTAVINHGYINQNAGATTVTLPVTAPLGSMVQLQGLGVGGWVLAAGVGQTIQLGASATSVAGSLTSANRYDTVLVVCIVADTTWSVSFCLSSGLTVA